MIIADYSISDSENKHVDTIKRILENLPSTYFSLNHVEQVCCLMLSIIIKCWEYFKLCWELLVYFNRVGDWVIPLYIQQFRLRSRSRDFCQFMEGFSLEKSGIGKKVSVSENLVSERNLDFRKFGLGKQVSVWKNLAVYYYKEVRNTVFSAVYQRT